MSSQGHPIATPVQALKLLLYWCVSSINHISMSILVSIWWRQPGQIWSWPGLGIVKSISCSYNRSLRGPFSHTTRKFILEVV